ncbi:MAG TPA: NAD-dependent deacylase [Candidatus Kapabacteria bacterium]|nr:NAD-dependent deacylase [Candidatus Kapabacteria bacterium]
MELSSEAELAACEPAVPSQNWSVIPSKLIEQLALAKRVSVLTGAGISAESGVPTFRDAQSGLWARFKPEELATPRAFRANPKLVWEWYAWRREILSNAKPNPGHFALAEMERMFPQFELITQNVDGLHQEAGSQKVVELHGNIRENKCFDEDVVIKEWAETGEVPPKCPRCGGWLRPAVVWFEEAMPKEEFRKAVAATNCDVFLTIGTSSMVYPASALPEEAQGNGAVVVEVNPKMTSFTPQANFHLGGPAGEILPELLQALTERESE